MDETTKRKTFYEELEHLMNCYPLENESNTPDFVLMEFVKDALKAFNRAVNLREKWYGREGKLDLDDQIKTFMEKI